MLPPETRVLIAREAFPDAQVQMVGSLAAIGYYTVSWYGTNIDDDRGCFAVVNPLGPLADRVGEFLHVTFGKRSVTVYVIGSYVGLLSDLGLTRRAYMAVSLLAYDPITATVAAVL